MADHNITLRRGWNLNLNKIKTAVASVLPYAPVRDPLGDVKQKHSPGRHHKKDSEEELPSVERYYLLGFCPLEDQKFQELREGNFALGGDPDLPFS